MKTIIFAHPWHGSFDKAILDKITERFDEIKEEYTIIDLYKENFNPLLNEEDLKLYSKGEYSDPSVGKYQEILKKSSEVIFIFPIWWSTMPAILKGFFDKVMLLNFAYERKPRGIKGLLSDINSAKVITTAGTPKFIMKILGFGMTMKTGILKGIGIKKVEWLHCCFSFENTDEKRKNFLKKSQNFVCK